MPHYRRFQDASVSEKILDTMFLLTIGLGYLFALTHLYFSHQGRDGQPGLSVEDVRIAYYGKQNQTRLGTALQGPMSDRANTADKQVIFDWLEHGSSKDEFDAKVAPILANNCTMCHSAESGMKILPLSNYDEVMVVAETDHGASVQSLVRVSHIHLFGISFILFFLGRIFLLCEMKPMIKRVTVAIPFIAMLLDILSWYITKAIPGFAYVVVLAGALMGISMAMQIFVSLYQMWLYTPKASDGNSDEPLLQ